MRSVDIKMCYSMAIADSHTFDYSNDDFRFINTFDCYSCDFRFINTFDYSMAIADFYIHLIILWRFPILTHLIIQMTIADF